MKSVGVDDSTADLVGIASNDFIFFTNFRKGIDPCAKKPPLEDPNKTNKDYEQPNPPPDRTYVNEDASGQYMELEDPKFAGYINQIPN